MSSFAQRKVLVLNRGWSPVAVVPLERAISLVVGTYKNDEPKARVLDASQDFRLFTWKDWSKLKAAADESVIHSATQSFRIPEIILLSRYNKLPQQRIHFSRRTIYKRDGNQCMYCGARPGTELLSIDHLIPRSAGGETTWQNCLLSCLLCNREKAAHVPDKTTIREVDANGKERWVDAFVVYFNSGRFPGGKKIIKQPIKPKFSLYQGEYRCKSWEQLLGAAYWETELVNDNK